MDATLRLSLFSISLGLLHLTSKISTLIIILMKKPHEFLQIFN